MIKINTPNPPKPLEVPTNPIAAWSNGFRFCANAMEEAIEKSLPKMDATAKAILLTNLENHVTHLDEPKVIRRRKKKPVMLMACRHPSKDIEVVGDGEHICTICGNTTVMRA